MARAMLFLAILNILSSCQKQYRKCEIQTSDRYLNAYNEILNEIIATSTYNYYLGDDEEVIFNMAGKGTYDSAEIESKVIRLHNRLFDDTARRCTLFLDTILRSKFEPQERFLNDSTSFARKLRNAIDEISHDHKTVVDSLDLVQTRYSANDYVSCTAKIKSIRNARI
ncbi:MAG: hypothetical protein KGO82_12295, partial [Bacteroidota bacterium]|nr:hypothetical protein [Bacteroidota bacterium]